LLILEIEIAMAGYVIIAILLYYHVKASFAVCLVVCSVIYWIQSDTFPSQIVQWPTLTFHKELNQKFDTNTIELLLSLVFLYIVYLNGLTKVFVFPFDCFASNFIYLPLTLFYFCIRHSLI
jgi:hypothetical protein